MLLSRPRRDCLTTPPHRARQPTHPLDMGGRFCFFGCVCFTCRLFNLLLFLAFKSCARWWRGTNDARRNAIAVVYFTTGPYLLDGKSGHTQTMKPACVEALVAVSQVLRVRGCSGGGKGEGRRQGEGGGGGCPRIRRKQAYDVRVLTIQSRPPRQNVKRPSRVL